MKQALIFCTLTFLACALAAGNGKAQNTYYGKDVIISAASDGNLYVAGGKVTVNAPVHGDLVVAGGTVVVNSTVDNDIMVAGGTLYVYGPVGGDVRCASGQVFIKSRLEGDLVILGGKIFVEKEAIINGSILAGGGDIAMDGTVNRNVRAASGNYIQKGHIAGKLMYKGGVAEINGTVDGKSIIAANKLLIGSGAIFHNDIRYWSESGAMNFGDAVINGKAVYDPALEIRSGRWHYLGHTTLLALVWYLGMAFIFLLLIQWLFPGHFKVAADFGYNRPFRSFGYGVLFLIAVPFTTVLLLFTVVGIPLAVLIGLAYIGLLLLSSIIAAVLITNGLNNWHGGNRWRYWRMVISSLAIFIILKLVSLIPFVGPLTLFIYVAISFGALIMTIDFGRMKRSG